MPPPFPDIIIQQPDSPPRRAGRGCGGGAVLWVVWGAVFGGGRSGRVGAGAVRGMLDIRVVEAGSREEVDFVEKRRGAWRPPRLYHPNAGLSDNQCGEA